MLTRITLDSNHRYALDPTRLGHSGRGGRRDQAGLCEDGGGNTLIPCHAHSVGAAIVSEAIDGFARYIRRSPPLVVTTEFSTCAGYQLHYKASQRARGSGIQALAPGASVQFQVPRAYRPYHFS